MSEFDPDRHANLHLPNGESQRMDRYNSALFTFIGNLSMYDHVFVSSETEEDELGLTEEPEVNQGVYIFNQNGAYEQLREFIVDNDFPQHLNATRVAPCDREAYERAALKDAENIPDYPPDDWE